MLLATEWVEGLRLRRGEGDAQNDSQVDLEKHEHHIKSGG